MQHGLNQSCANKAIVADMHTMNYFRVHLLVNDGTYIASGLVLLYNKELSKIIQIVYRMKCNNDQ